MSVRHELNLKLSGKKKLRKIKERYKKKLFCKRYNLLILHFRENHFRNENSNRCYSTSILLRRIFTYSTVGYVQTLYCIKLASYQIVMQLGM